MTGTMKILRKLLAGAAILGMAFSGAAIGEGTADASTAPVAYAAHNNGWHAYVKPGDFYFGNGGAPYFTGLDWTSWTSASAWDREVVDAEARMLPQLRVPVLLPLGRGLPEHGQVAQRGPVLRPDGGQVLVCGEVALGSRVVRVSRGQGALVAVPRSVPVPVDVPAS